jgi:HEAT repeat protein
MTLLLPQLPPKWSAALRDVQAQGAPARIAAAARLAQPSDEREIQQALDGLERLCTDADARVRAAAVQALAELADPRTLPLLRARLADSDGYVRELSAVGLGELGWAVAGAALLGALRSEHPELRFQALAAAAESGEPQLAAHVIRMFGDSDPYVRACAVAAARSLERSDELLAKLRAALGDPDIKVRRQAGVTLAAHADPAGADALLEALGDSELVLDALEAAPQLSDARVRERLAFMAASVLGSRLITASAARALGRLGDARAAHCLRELLRGFRTQGRNPAVQAIGELELAELAPDLARLARRPRAVDPGTLAGSLARLAAKAPEAAAALRQLAARSDEFGEAARSFGN